MTKATKWNIRKYSASTSMVKVFALLVEVTEDEEGGDAIIARVDQEDGEDVYVAPTDEEFDAANAKFDELLDE